MDPNIWSKMPQDIIKVVLLRLPPAKLFQLQLVSPKSELLTSTAFLRAVTAAARERDAAAAAAGWSTDSQHRQERVVACVMRKCSSMHNFVSAKLKPVKVDVSYLPKVFWTQETTIVGAADGLLCMSSADYDKRQHERNLCLLNLKQPEPEPELYHFVLNPVTGTYVVLPRVPFDLQGMVQWLPSTTEVTLIVHSYPAHQGAFWFEWKVATYNLTTGGWSRWSVAQGLMGPPPPAPNHRACDTIAQVTVCGGRTFCYYWDRRVHVHERGPAVPHVLRLTRWTPGAVQLVEAAPALDAPSVELLGLKPVTEGPGAEAADNFDRHVFMVTHRGVVFFVAQVRGQPANGVVAGLWRLNAAREPMEWEPVGRLEMQDVARELKMDECTQVPYACVVGVCGVRELLCCSLRLWMGCPEGVSKLVMLGFNLDKEEWELFHSEEELVHWEQGEGYPMGARPLELRPDLFLE